MFELHDKFLLEMDFHQRKEKNAKNISSNTTFTMEYFEVPWSTM